MDYLDLTKKYGAGTDLALKIEAAVMIAVNVIAKGEDTGQTDTLGEGFSQQPDAATAHAARIAWARTALNETRRAANQIQKFVLAEHNDKTASQIDQATDVTIQKNVNAAVDLIAGV